MTQKIGERQGDRTEAAGDVDVRVDVLFARVSRRLLDDHPGDEWGRMLRSPGLKTAGRFYVFTTGGELVVKLPADRVAELIAAGAGRRCEPRKGRPMREWVRLAPHDEDACAAYLHEARTFVAAQTPGLDVRTQRPPEELDMTRPPALNLATAFLDAWTGHDLETAGTYLADDFTFDGPIAHYRSAKAFLTESRRFVETIKPGRTTVAAFGDGREALLLYDLQLLSGATMRIADHYTIRAGKIQTETILWDTQGFR